MMQKHLCSNRVDAAVHSELWKVIKSDFKPGSVEKYINE